MSDNWILDDFNYVNQKSRHSPTSDDEPVRMDVEAQEEVKNIIAERSAED